MPVFDYKKAKQEFDHVMARPLIQKRNWQIISAVLLVSNLILVSGLIFLAKDKKVLPYLIEVDKLGRAQYVGIPKSIQYDDQAVIKSFIYDFIERSRTVSFDFDLMSKNISKAVAVADQNTVNNFLTTYYRDNNPFEKAKKESVSVEPVGLLKQSSKSYIVEWDETTKTKDYKVLSTVRYKAFIQVDKLKDTSLQDLESNPDNPFNYIVTNLSWSKLQ